LALELGVDVYTNCGVERIELDTHGRVSGVWVDEVFQPATAVVSNVDVATTYKHLLPNTPPIAKRLKQLNQAEPSCSGFILLWGVEGEHAELAHHNIFFSPDYPAEFTAIFKQGVMPSNPTIYASITSKTDADHAPPGHENWFVLVNAPPTGDNWDWSSQTTAYRNLVLDKLAERGFNLRDKIRYEQILTPIDLERMNGAYRGALYGPSSNAMMAAFRRPHNRVKDVPGLYLAGGTTHPGGGVPMVALSGKVAAEMILADLGQSVTHGRVSS
jgi:diapolycopene oxygenase